MKMVGRDGAVAEVPEEKVQEAFQSGQFGFLPDTTVPVVTKLGRVGRVPWNKADDAFGRGARIADPAELKEAVQEERYGEGIGNLAAATGEGLARGVTGGLSDIAAIGLTKALVGKEAGEKVREHLAGEKGTHGIAAGGAEMVGTIAPLLVPGAGEADLANIAAKGAEATRAAEGLTAAADAAKGLKAAEGLAPAAAEAVPAAAEAAPSVPSLANQFGTSLGKAVRQAGAVPRAIAGAGELTERAIGRLVGKDAAGLMGRTAQKIAARGGGAAVEGALFGLGNEVDESVLGDTDLNGEKLLAAAGHGALLAGAGAGLLTGAGELAREVAGRASPLFRRIAGEQAWKAASPGKGFSETAIRRAGGTAAAGQSALDEGLLDHASSVGELRDATLAAVQRRGEELSAAYRGSPAKVTLKEISDMWDRHIKEFEGKALFQDVVRALKEGKQEFMARVTPEIAETVATKHAPAVPAGPLSTEEMQAVLKEHPSIFSDTALQKQLGLKTDFGPVPRLVRTKGVPATSVPITPTAESIAKAAEQTEVPIQVLIEQRQALGQKAYQEQLQNDPKGRVKALRGIYGDLTEIENRAFENAEKNLGGASAQAIKEQRLHFQRLSLFKDALEKSNARFVTNRNLSMSDYLMAMGSVAAGHPVIGVAQALGHKILRERGNAWTARFLDKLSTWGAVDRAAGAVDREIDRGVAGFFRPGERSGPRIRPRMFTGPKEEGQAGDYKERVKAVAAAAGNPDLHADHVASVASTIEGHAPKTATAFQRTSLAVTGYLANRIPQGHVPLNTMVPHLEEPRVSDADKAKFNRAFDMGHDPVGFTFDRLNKGTLTRTDVANLQAMYPKIYDQVRQQMMEELSTQGKKLDFDRRMQLGLLLDIPADPAIEPLFMQGMQKTFEDQPPEQQPATPKASPKRELKVFEEKAKLQGN